MEANRHANSKRITIFRAGSFSDDAQTGAADFMSMSRKSIGSYLQSHLGKGVGTGLTFEEIDLLMPLVIDIPKDDRTFRAGVTDFFASLATDIPYGTGKELEIGLSISNDQPVTYCEKKDNGQVVTNLPINLNEYIRYRHAIRHPYVVMSKEEAKGNQLVQFYIFDPETVVKSTAEVTTTRDKAITLYLSLKEDMKKVDMMLTLMKVDPRMFSGKNAAAEKLEELRALADIKPKDFVDQHTEKHFEERYTLHTLLNTGICKEIGKRIADVETGAILGNNEEEAIYWILDKTNSQTLSLMKTRMQEALKKAVPNPAKRMVNTTARK